jgi:hypothetical protein
MGIGDEGRGLPRGLAHRANIKLVSHLLLCLSFLRVCLSLTVATQTAAQTPSASAGGAQALRSPRPPLPPPPCVASLASPLHAFSPRGLSGGQASSIEHFRV